MPVFQLSMTRRRLAACGATDAIVRPRQLEDDPGELNSAPSSSGEPIRLKRQINLLHGVSIIVGIIIGAGIFVSPVGIVAHTKSVGLSLVMWASCGVFNTMCALCYAELGTTIPNSGGEYAYILKAFGDFPAFLCLWVNLVLICPVGLAASSLIFATYIMRPLYPYCEPPKGTLQLIAATIIVLLVAINMINVRWATRIQVVITFSKLSALLMIIVIGVMYLGKGATENFQNAFDGSDYSASALAISFYSGFWAFGGWSYLNFLTDELVKPHKNLPRAIGISMLIVTAVYLVANVSYLVVLTPAEMVASTAVAVTFAERTISAVSWIVPLLIAISVCGSMNGIALSMSRLFWAGAVNGHFPAVIGMINYKRLTPSPSLIVMLILTLILQTYNDIFYLIEMEGFAFAAILTTVFAGQVYLRIREPLINRPIKVPLALPITLALISLSILCLTVYQKPHESLLSALLVAIGIPIYIFGVKWKRKPKELQDYLDSATFLIQKLFMVVPPDDACHAE